MKKLMTLVLVLALAAPAFAAAPTVPPTEPIPASVKENMPPAQKAKAPEKKAKKADVKKEEGKKDEAKDK